MVPKTNQKSLTEKLCQPFCGVEFWVKFTVFLVIVLTVNSIDPFDWKSSPEQSAELFLQKLTSPFRSNTSTEDAITVILIDETYYAPDKPLWPIPSREFNFKILKKILKHKPKAVFLDISYPDAPREIIDGSRNTRQEALKVLAKSFTKLSNRYQTPILIGDAFDNKLSLRDHCNTNVPTPPLTQAIDSADSRQRNFEPLILESNILTKTFLKELTAKQSKVQIVNVNRDLDKLSYPLAQSVIIENSNNEVMNFASPALTLYKIYSEGIKNTNIIKITSSSALWPLKNKSLSPKQGLILQYPQPDPIKHISNRNLASQWHDLRSQLPKTLPDWMTLYSMVGYKPNDKLTNVCKISEQQNEMILHWELYQSNLMQDIYSTGLVKGCDGIPNPAHRHKYFSASLIKLKDSFWFVVNNVLDPILEKLFSLKKNDLCPSINHFSAKFLEDPESFEYKDNPVANANKLKDSVHKSIHGKIVMVGTKLTQTKDITYSPLNKYIPGVFWHAVALKNLIDMDTSVSRPISTLSKNLWTALVAFLVYYSGAVIHLFKENTSGNSRSFKLFIPLLFFLAWLLILGFSYANIPLAYALIGALYKSLELAQKKVTQLIQQYMTDIILND